MYAAHRSFTPVLAWVRLKYTPVAFAPLSTSVRPQTPNLSVNQKNTSVNAFCIQQPTMCLVKGDGFLFPRVLLTFLKKVFGDFKGKGHNVVHFYCEWWYHWKVDSLPSTYLMHLYERFVRLI